MRRKCPKTGILMCCAAILTALPLISGCDDPPPGAHYSVIAGKVLACHSDTGDLRIRATRLVSETPTDETMYCIITGESEIYVNDKLSTMDEIQLGDEVELIGHRDPDPRTRRFVVSFAYLDHSLPPPAPPVFAPAPATQDAPSSNSTEIQSGKTSGNSTKED